MDFKRLSHSYVPDESRIAWKDTTTTAASWIWRGTTATTYPKDFPKRLTHSYEQEHQENINLPLVHQYQPTSTPSTTTLTANNPIFFFKATEEERKFLYHPDSGVGQIISGFILAILLILFVTEIAFLIWKSHRCVNNDRLLLLSFARVCGAISNTIVFVLLIDLFGWKLATDGPVPAFACVLLNLGVTQCSGILFAENLLAVICWWMSKKRSADGLRFARNGVIVVVVTVWAVSIIIGVGFVISDNKLNDETFCSNRYLYGLSDRYSISTIFILLFQLFCLSAAVSRKSSRIGDEPSVTQSQMTGTGSGRFHGSSSRLAFMRRRPKFSLVRHSIDKPVRRCEICCVPISSIEQSCTHHQQDDQGESIKTEIPWTIKHSTLLDVESSHWIEDRPKYEQTNGNILNCNEETTSNSLVIVCEASQEQRCQSANANKKLMKSEIFDALFAKTDDQAEKEARKLYELHRSQSFGRKVAFEEDSEAESWNEDDDEGRPHSVPCSIPEEVAANVFQGSIKEARVLPPITKSFSRPVCKNNFPAMTAAFADQIEKLPSSGRETEDELTQVPREACHNPLLAGVFANHDCPSSQMSQDEKSFRSRQDFQNDDVDVVLPDDLSMSPSSMFWSKLAHFLITFSPVLFVYFMFVFNVAKDNISFGSMIIIYLLLTSAISCLVHSLITAFSNRHLIFTSFSALARSRLQEPIIVVS